MSDFRSSSDSPVFHSALYSLAVNQDVLTWLLALFSGFSLFIHYQCHGQWSWYTSVLLPFHSLLDILLSHSYLSETFFNVIEEAFFHAWEMVFFLLSYRIFGMIWYVYALLILVFLLWSITQKRRRGEMYDLLTISKQRKSAFTDEQQPISYKSPSIQTR